MEKGSTIMKITLDINDFEIIGHSFHEWEPGNLACAKLTVLYQLGTRGSDGSFVPSPLREHAGKIDLSDVGEDRHLTRFLETAGPEGSELRHFSPADLRRLVETEIRGTLL